MARTQLLGFAVIEKLMMKQMLVGGLSVVDFHGCKKINNACGTRI